MAVCSLDDRAITDREQQQIREAGASPPAPYRIEQFRAGVHEAGLYDSTIAYGKDAWQREKAARLLAPAIMSLRWL